MTSADLKDEVTCCICTEIYTDPVTLICGHSFCQLCITKTWDNQEERDYSCPECRHRFRVKPVLKRALRLSNIAESVRSTHRERSEQEGAGITCIYCIQYPVPAAKTCLLCEASLCDDHLRVHSTSAEHILCEPTASLENRKCSDHKKVLEYYCCEEKTCICVSCRLDGEHRGHQVETLNEASEKKKVKLRNILEKLTSEREEAEKKVQSLLELKRQLQGKTAGVTEQVTALIRDIREQLEALEKRVLGEISRQEEQVSLQVSDLIQQLEIKKEELSKKMGHIEELRKMTNPVKVLQRWESDRADYCDTGAGDNEDTERHDIKVHDVGDLDVGLISVTLHSGLAGIVTRVTRQHHVPEVSDMLLDVNTTSDMILDVNTTSDMILDVSTAGNDVYVSSDLKTVSVTGIKKSRLKSQKKFQDYPQVLSCRSFCSGRHYWEVEGSESGIWMVGMAYRSLARSGEQSKIGNNNKTWGLGRWGCFNNQYYVGYDSKEIRLPQPPSYQRLGIFLDYDAGRLSFYELCDPIRHIHTFTATFTEPLHAIFWVYGVNSWVRI